MRDSRIEKDSLGEIEVPADALYGAQTQRAVNNFGLHRRKMPPGFIVNLAMIKSAAAQANAECDALSRSIARLVDGCQTEKTSLISS